MQCSAQQDNTTEDGINAFEWVTICDPRHPLYNQQVRLLRRYQSRRRQEQCLIEILSDVHRRVPLAVTSLAEEPLAIAPLSLSLPAVQELLQCYQQLLQQRTEASHAATLPVGTFPIVTPTEPPPTPASAARPATTLAHPDASPTASGATSLPPDLPTSRNHTHSSSKGDNL